MDLTISNSQPAAHNPQISDLVAAFLTGKSPRTLEAYRRDLEDFAAWAGVADINDAARLLLTQPHGSANHLGLNYRNHLLERGLAPATVNRRLAALRSLVKLGNTLGIVSWQLVVEGVKSKAFRDTKGCGLDGVRLLLQAAASQRDKIKSVRDITIIHLLFDLGLRRGELAALDIKDVDLDGGRVSIIGKGRAEREPLTLPDETKEALESWLETHPGGTEALFPNRDRAGPRKRISGTGLYLLVKALGKKVGVDTRPHGLRHAAITEVLNLSHGDLRLGQTFARHANPSTTMKYDDNRLDSGGEAARMLAKTV